jgi:hypothetical protein
VRAAAPVHVHVPTHEQPAPPAKGSVMHTNEKLDKHPAKPVPSAPAPQHHPAAPAAPAPPWATARGPAFPGSRRNAQLRQTHIRRNGFRG